MNDNKGERTWLLLFALIPTVLIPIDKEQTSDCGSTFLLADRYRVEAPLRSGGFSRTFTAVDKQLFQKTCIIKQFCPNQADPNDLQKAFALFHQEAILLDKLGHHPQIPSLLAYLEEDEHHYLVQEYFKGQDLFQDLTHGGPYREDQIWKVLNDLLPVLQFIHNKQVIHRDIKPSNIIHRQTDSLGLIDFGSSLQLGGTIRANSGTPGYAAPEQMQGLIYPSSDLYSLGVVCIRLLTGYLPSKDGFDPLFHPEGHQWLWQQTGVSVSTKLEYVLNKLLQPNLEDRFQSAEEVLAVLAQSPTALSLKTYQSLISPLQLELQPSKSSMILASDMDVDYTTLQKLLAAQMFKAADEETCKLMLHITDSEVRGCPSIESMEAFPGNDLSTIDWLWKRYSAGKFGFSIQQQIYQALGGKINFNYSIWRNFGERVGWFLENHWLDYSSLSFEHYAPSGHLPAACFAPDKINYPERLSCHMMG